MKWLAILILVAAGCAFLYHLATTPAHQLPSVQVNALETFNADRKVASLVGDEALAQASGRPVPVSITLTDSELTSIVTQRMSQTSITEADGLVLHAAGPSLEATANGHYRGFTFPIYLDMAPTIVSGHPQLKLEDAQVGSLPMPGPLEAKIQTEIGHALNFGPALAQISSPQIIVGRGEVTLTGTAVPSAAS